MPNRQPLFINGSHYYDQDFDAREEHGEVAIVHYASRRTKKIRVWKIGALHRDPTDGTQRFVGFLSVFAGLYYVTLRGKSDVEIKRIPTKAEALDLLRWAVQRFYP